MIKYRLATIKDNQQLIELTAASGMMGETALRIDRKPDFFKLLQMRGETRVFLAFDNEMLVGSLCVSLQNVYVGKQVFPLHYIGDFKVAEKYRNKGIGLQLCNEMADYLLSKDADLAFLNFSKGNTKPVSFFKNRPHVPDFTNIGDFNIHQFIGKKKKAFHPRYKIELSPVTDEVVAFLNFHYSRYELGSVITKEKLEGTGVYTIQHENKILAAMCLVDTMNVKQNVVIRLSWKNSLLLLLVNRFASLLGISKMPALHEPVRMLYIKYLAIEGHDKQLVKFLIDHARNAVYKKEYSFVSIGLHEKDPLQAYLSRQFKLTFNSTGMLVSIKDNRELIEKVKQGIPFEDYSLV